MGSSLRFSFFLSLCAALFLSGCNTKNEVLELNENAVKKLPNVHQLFVVTNRAAITQGGGYGSERAHQNSYQKIGVSVPVIHKPGKIEKAQANPDPAKHFAVVTQHKFTARADFRASINSQLAQITNASPEVMVYVHGFNNSYQDALFRLTQIANDFDFPAVKTLFTWPSKGEINGYNYDRESVISSRNYLQETLEQITQTDTPRIILVAHSLGGHLSMETLRQMYIEGSPNFRKKLRGVILLSPDIDIDVFREQLVSLKPLPKPFVVFVSSKDRALKISQQNSDSKNRLGRLDNDALLQDFEISIIDISNIKGGDSLHHNTTATSPTMISLINGLPDANGTDNPFEQQVTAGEIGGRIVTTNKTRRIVLDVEQEGP